MGAQCAIVFAGYMFLVVGIRENQDLRSAGPPFCLAADELADISFAETMEKLQLFLIKHLGAFHASKQDIYALIMEFLTDLPAEIGEFPDLDGFKAGLMAKSGGEV